MSEDSKLENVETKTENVASGIATSEDKCLKDQTNKKNEGKPKGGGGGKKKGGKNADENEADGEFKLKTAKVI